MNTAAGFLPMVAVGLCLLAATAPAGAQALPQRFSDTTVFSGLNLPTSVDVAPDGRVFVAEKSGMIKVFDGLNDSSPTTFANLRTLVYNIGDRPVRAPGVLARRGDRLLRIGGRPRGPECARLRVELASG